MSETSEPPSRSEFKVETGNDHNKHSEDPKERLVKTPPRKKPNRFLTLVCTVWTCFSILNFTWCCWLAARFMQVVNLFRCGLTERDELMLFGKILRGGTSFFVVDCNPFWSMRSTCEVPLKEMPSKAIFMSNHVAFADPFLLAAAQRPVESKYAGKGTFWKIPMAGFLLKKSGDMPVHFIWDKEANRERTRPGNREEILKSAAHYLDLDIPLTVFPEGAVSRQGFMLPFKEGFFHLAMEKNVPIIPIGMWGTQHCWLNRAGVTMCPGTMHVAFGAPIYPDGKDVVQLMTEVWNCIQELRNGLPNFDPKELGDLAYQEMQIYCKPTPVVLDEEEEEEGDIEEQAIEGEREVIEEEVKRAVKEAAQELEEEAKPSDEETKPLEEKVQMA